MREYPPMLSGTALQQIAALRDYLVRQARDEGGTALPSSAAQLSSARGEQTGAGGLPAQIRESKESREQAARLRAMIVKTAKDSREQDAVLNSSIGELAYELRQDYLARSEFGQYRQEIGLLIEATARQIVESYAFAEEIRAAQAQLGEMGEELAAYRTEIEGQIRRGYLEDPDSHHTVLGIAIAQQLHFTGREMTDGGWSYYELAPGQTLGLYTSTGWQFWVNGRRVGWFDSADGMLHTVSQTVEQELRMGDWTFSAVGGFGIKYLG